LSNVAALFVQPNGVYPRLGLDCWPEERDARRYTADYPVIAHPPCAAWGAYSKPTPKSLARGPLRGDDGGCFASALESLRRCGGVLEHPRGSHAFEAFGIVAPVRGSWTRQEDLWVCEVDQGCYGHRAKKATWLIYASREGVEPTSLLWQDAEPPSLGTGQRSGNVETMSKRERAATPRVCPSLADLGALLAARIQAFSRLGRVRLLRRLRLPHTSAAHG
jgi:hypothetical protein